MSRPTTAAQKAWNNKANAAIQADVAKAQLPATGISWWVGLTMDEFYAEARKRQLAMAMTKIALSIPARAPIGWASDGRGR